ncbi:hypothetical protein Tco_0133739 [Tanacetum coccineum]
MQGPVVKKQERECKLYDEFDKFTYKKGESLHEYYLRFTLLLNDMNIYKMPLEQFQVNTKFLNTLPDEWSKFVTDVKLFKDLSYYQLDDPIDADHHMKSFLTAVVTSRGKKKKNKLLMRWEQRENYTPGGASEVNTGKTTNDIFTTAKGMVIFPSSVLSPRGKGMKHAVCSHGEFFLEWLTAHTEYTILDNSEIEITSDSNIIPYSQYLSETQQKTVQNSNSSAQQDALILSMLSNTSLLKSKLMKFEMNQVLSENERLLAQAIDHDIVKTVVNLSMNDGCETVNECQKCLELKTELLNKKDIVDKETYDKLCKNFTTLKKHCITLEADSQLNQEIFQQKNSVLDQNAPSFTQLFELSELRAQSQEKDTVIVKLKEQIKSLKGNVDDSTSNGHGKN